MGKDEHPEVVENRENLGIYLLTQDANCGYDTYDSAVVVARSVADALSIHPRGNGAEVPDTDDAREGPCGCWTGRRNVTARRLGDAAYGTSRGVVCASFNAG